MTGFSEIMIRHQRFHALSLNAMLCCVNLMHYQAYIPYTAPLIRVHAAAFSAAFGSPITPTTDDNFPLRSFIWEQWRPMQLRPLLQIDRLSWGRGPPRQIWAEIVGILDSYDTFHKAIRQASADFAQEATAATALLAIA